MKLLYPTNIELDIDLIKGFAVSLHPYDVNEPISDELADAEIIVTWSNAPSNLKDAKGRLTNLKWIQSLSAGPNDIFNAGFDTKKIALTSGSGLHDHTVAEHTLALLLASVRRLDEMKEYQLQGKWPWHLGGPQPDRPKGRLTTLAGANVTIWGYGNIAKTVAPLLTALGANVRGVARSTGVRNGVEVYAEDKLPEILSKTDALVMILPGSESTKHALNKERLQLLPHHAWVVNVGRGTSIDEDALADALDGGEIGGAALDVFETEPLPEGHRLWKTKNLIISPHAAGGRPRGAEQLIASNLRRFMAGQELQNLM